jgi:hypothetical protein
MKVTKSVGSKAFEVLQQYKNAGVPDYITASEVFTLTNGIFGLPYNHPLRNTEFRLVDVAVMVAKHRKKNGRG